MKKKTYTAHEITVTANEITVLQAIARNEMNTYNYGRPENAQGTLTWTSTLGEGAYDLLDGMKMPGGKGISGTVSSLVEKELVTIWNEGPKNEHSIAHTDLGFAVWSTIIEEHFTTEAPAAEEPAPKKKSMTQMAKEILTPLLKKGKHTQAELKAVLIAAHVTVTTANVILSDSKNAKYNKFDKLVVEDANNKLKFQTN